MQRSIQRCSALLQSYGSEGLQLVQHSEIVLAGQAVLQLTFDPGAFGRAPVSARCQLDHPFYVKNKGGTNDEETVLKKHPHIDLFTLCLSSWQAGRHFTRAWLWCIMGYRATRWRWEVCVFLQDTEMPNTPTTRWSLTHSGGKMDTSDRLISCRMCVCVKQLFFMCVSSSVTTSPLWIPLPFTCWAVWPDGGGPPSPAGELFLRTETHHMVLSFTAPTA